ncbi:hybrid sensor histidine kinase/response regulator [Bordetella genomosp. 13]|uniref:hybrid sensor histidine kinase/response regulator n=1 Tax=Bordetella genomosp. 13 TaxID=463040 RepID=UPI001C9311E1|nr:hybrid sensor histidine kinase/response regulator [Bordetella genomosp. 13]
MPFDADIFDWSQTPLGPKETWSAALQTTYDIVMANGSGMCAVWGPEKTMLYNAAFAPFLGQRHPGAMGRGFHEVWQDVWADIGPLVDRALSGESVRFENMHLVMTRNGREEDTYWTFSYSPLRDGGRIVGVLDVALETTAAVMNQERARADAQRVQLALAAGAIIGTWVWHLPTDRFTVDEAFARSFGLDPALGRAGLSLEQVIATVHPDDRQGLIEAIDEVIGRGGAYAHQYRVRRYDGLYYWLEANGRVDLAPDGTPLYFPGVLIDVQGRRVIEAERDQAIARLRALNAELEQKVLAQSMVRGRNWQLTSDMLGVLNAQGYFEASNPAWEATLGWSEDEIAQTHFLDFLHPEDRPGTEAAWQAVHDRGEIAPRFENRYRHKRGGWRWLSWVGVPDEGKVYCAARDVTAEKEAQAELVTRTAERDRLWETTNDLMGTVGQHGYLKAINPAWSAQLGWSREELLGQPFSALMVPVDQPVVAEAMRRLAEGEDVGGFGGRVRCRNGSERDIMWTATFDAGMGVFHMVGHDLTELRAAEESLRQSQKMEAVGQLTGGLAHDFNNLLAGISGSLELMHLRVGQGRLHDVEKYMAAAQGATRRAAALTHRLLAFSRRQTLAPKPAKIGHVVLGMMDMIQRSVGPGISVEFVPTADPWTTLVDVSQMENALLNLCLNARDAMPEGGRISIESANRWLDRPAARQLDLPEGAYLELCVLDTGTGMPPDILARAFDPFFTTKPLGEGTGLGLSMIYGFAKQSGGQARIYSEVGHGTRVCIYLPRHRGEAAAEESAADDPPAQAARTNEIILVVDDEPTVRMLVVDVLEELGYTTIEAGDAVAGLKVLESDARIDLLLTDVGLPNGMNGRQMADAARQLRPGLKVLFITGYAENSLLTNGQLEPGMAILTKPFAVDVLTARVRELIAS